MFWRKTKTGAEQEAKLDALNKVQAIIEFDLDGNVITANHNFLSVVSYSLEEITGRHHSMFVDPIEAQGPEYRAFWQRLRSGEIQATQFKRIAKGGREVWIEASYNPLKDRSGKPYKIVKFATDVTSQVKLLTDLRRIIDHNFTEIDQTLGQSSSQSTAASGATQAAASNVSMMAAAAEELAASVEQIAEGMVKSHAATTSASATTMAAGESAQRLSKAADSMSGVVNLIQNIAAQINLLALNATIESARAGDAGRGFAVVAQEVKKLANDAAKATEQISSEIDQVQMISGEVVSSLASIGSSFEVMREHVAATAAAMEQQRGVTRDMSSNMHSASGAVNGIFDNVAAISAAVAQVTAAVGVTRDAARVLAR
ncbi:methyl-accepting chemotaxis protein [Hansschlegelia quercus]|uniref:PAS domain-containing methyl-accepting chemotaxis protein n=1 Tax=Hansschlegelia quercus TaxID=2528245 RepID=A0A4V2JD53_9HYPH|nr:methyl-accepting chemotaxis protein [Hansschlegelia quercus]TBN47045.1 PAS domain-containing methyl-accepting chemotaxis protein [Hansschlegelia quercus]